MYPNLLEERHFMKGLLKLSTVALSAAMVAGMSTPVFAAGANVSGTTTVEVPKIQVVDANNNIVATTNTDIKKTYDYKGNANDANDDPTKTTVNLKVGSVKNLTATAADGSAVKWAYDTEDESGKALSDDALKAEKKAVTLDNGKITVTKDAAATNAPKSVDLLAYTDESLAKKEDGTTDGTLKEKSYVTVTVNIVAANDKDHLPTISYVNGDSTYVDGDFDFDAYATDTGVADKKTLPEVTHSSAEMKHSSTTINHVATGSSATFTINTGDDADYNTLVTYEAPKDQKTGLTVQNGLTVKTTSNKLEGTVSVTGNVPNRFGVAKFDVKVNDVATNSLYVIADASSDVNVYRVYNPNTGEHFYTTSAEEADTLDKIGWDLEGIGWVAPSTGKEVYRLYNENAGEHHYTTSEKEKNALVAAGWKDEGVAFYSASKEYTRIYREYNKNAVAFNHNYTTSKDENTKLVAVGWKYEGVAFYALKEGKGATEAREAVDAALKA
jgi:hypothetical protein